MTLVHSTARVVVPNRCIWCLAQLSGDNTDESHVYPAAVGNRGQQVLPPGVVCKSCNGYFGQKVEPAFLADPSFHVLAVTAGLLGRSDRHRFRNEIFDPEHPAVGDQVNHHLNVNADVNGETLRLDIAHTLRGSMVVTYDQGRRRRISQAIHKMAFESLAWYLIVDGQTSNEINVADLYSDRFEPVRQWSRRGNPTNRIRPVIRRPPQRYSPNWVPGIWQFGGDYGFQLRVLGEWYAVALTGNTQSALNTIKNWIPDVPSNAWILGDSICAFSQPIDTGGLDPSDIEVWSATLAEDAAITQGKIALAGITNEFMPSVAFPCPAPPMMIALSLALAPSMAGRVVRVRTSLVDEQGWRFGTTEHGLEIPVDLPTIPGRERAQVNHVAPITGFSFWHEGLHHLHVSLNGETRATLPIYVWPDPPSFLHEATEGV